MKIERKIIKADGTEVLLPHQVGLAELERLIGATSVASVTLWHLDDAAMYVDDLGHMRGLPVNETASRLYRERERYACQLGNLDHAIRGDVAIVPKTDF